MTADSKAELHEFAEIIGIKRCWYHKGNTHPHYDITLNQRDIAVQAGAVEVSQKELLVISKHLVKAE